MTDALFNESIPYYLPSIILSGTVLLLMLLTAYKRNHRIASTLASIGLLGALVAQTQQIGSPIYQTSLFIFDGIATLVSCFIILAGLVISLLLFQWLQKLGEDKEEYYLLLLLAVEGALMVTASHHFASFFLGLELMSLSLVAMIAYQGNCNKALEAGIKYLVLSSAASAFMLLAMAILFLYTGTLSLPGIQEQASISLSNTNGDLGVLIRNCAIVLLLMGMTFKLSLVPAHLWAADVFEGSPLPTNAMLASISKASVFVVLLRLFDGSLYQTAIIDIIAIVAAASMLIGNLLGLLQRNILRLMAYSSIGHFGYILLAILALGQSSALLQTDPAGILGTSAFVAKEAALYYIIAYIVTITGLFSMLMLLPEMKTIDDLSGLLWKKPAIASVLIATILSLAGIPLTIGFVGKFYLTMAAVNMQQWILLAALITGSIIGLFYYLRLILIMADKSDSSSRQPSANGFQFAHFAVMLLIISVVIGSGVMPSLLANLIEQAIHA